MLIIASLIEREAMVAKERPIIASVIYNRLRDDIRLDIDATTPLRGGQLEAAAEGVRAPEPEPVQHARAPGPSARPDRQPRARLDQGRGPPGEDRLPLLRGQAGHLREHNFAKTDAEFQGYVNEYNRARDKNGGKSPTTC